MLVRVERIIPGIPLQEGYFGVWVGVRGLFQAIIITSIPLQEGHIWSVGQSREDCSRLL